MRQILEGLKTEAEDIKSSKVPEESLNSFISKLRRAIKDIRSTEADQAIHDKLIALEEFKTFDKLPWITKLFHHMIIFKARPDYYDDWKGKGKHLYDLDTIITKLDALLFRLDKK